MILMKNNDLLDKLKKYEECACDGECNSDYLCAIGEAFTLYIEECVSSNVNPTINGFVKNIDKVAKDFKLML